MTLVGLLILIVSIFVLSELNAALLSEYSYSTESVVELEISENEFDSSKVLLSKHIGLYPAYSQLVYYYRDDSILFDLSKDFFRPPSLT